MGSFEAYDDLKELVDDLAARYAITAERLVEIERKEELAKVDQAAHESAASIVRAVAKEVQDSVQVQVSDSVNRCLTAVFDEPYEFAFRFVEKRGKTEAELVFTRDGHEIDPMHAAGGGVIDVAAFALRLASIVIDPNQARILILDEPFKFVSRDYLPKVAVLIVELAEALGVQIIMVTHIPQLIVGKVTKIG